MTAVVPAALLTLRGGPIDATPCSVFFSSFSATRTTALRPRIAALVGAPSTTTVIGPLAPGPKESRSGRTPCGCCPTRVGAGVQFTELDREQRDREHDQDRRRRDRPRPGPVADAAAPAGESAVLVRGGAGVVVAARRGGLGPRAGVGRRGPPRRRASVRARSARRHRRDPAAPAPG